MVQKQNKLRRNENRSFLGVCTRHRQGQGQERRSRPAGRASWSRGADPFPPSARTPLRQHRCLGTWGGRLLPAPPQGGFAEPSWWGSADPTQVTGAAGSRAEPSAPPSGRLPTRKGRHPGLGGPKWKLPLPPRWGGLRSAPSSVSPSERQDVAQPALALWLGMPRPCREGGWGPWPQHCLGQEGRRGPAGFLP